MDDRRSQTDHIIRRLCFLVSGSLLLAALAAAAYTGEWKLVLPQFFHLLTSPSKLITDYFSLGGLSSTFLNAGLCGLAMSLILLRIRKPVSAGVLTGYFLVIAHAFYGLNLLNLWPCFFGVFLYCRVRKLRFSTHFPAAMYATSLGPFISELLFRYTAPERFDPAHPQVTLLGVILALVLGTAAGFLIPAMLPGVRAMHKAYNLYNAGITIGLLGFFLFSLLYRCMGQPVPQAMAGDNPVYAAHGGSFGGFVTVYLALLFFCCLFSGWWLNGKSLRGYGELLRSTGHGMDFSLQFGMPVCLINLGIYGFCVLGYMLTVIALTPGAGFTGPTLGVTLAALSFFASGQHPRNVWPIFAGYALLYGITGGIGLLAGIDPGWTLSSQPYLNGLAFATGLCPITGKFGAKAGVAAGVVCGALCASTSAIHGGFVLYNGGLTAGLTCLILVPVLEHYYGVPARQQDEARL